MSEQSQFTVGLVQMACRDDRQHNFARASELVSECARRGAKIVCLQELSFDPYFCQAEDHSEFARAEGLDGGVRRWSAGIAQQYGIVLLCGLFERRAAGVFHNSFLVFEPNGELTHVYRKTHIPDDPHFYEKFFFTPGDNPCPAFDTSVGRIGIGICWDQWFPEVARLTAMQGANILFYPTAIGWQDEDKTDYGESQRSAWRTMMRSHAIANGVYVVAPNRTGLEKQIEFWGSSFICDPYGNFLAEAGDKETILTAEVDLATVEQARTHWPFFRDRRIDLYQDLTQRWRDGT